MHSTESRVQVSVLFITNVAIVKVNSTLGMCLKICFGALPAKQVCITYDSVCAQYSIRGNRTRSISRHRDWIRTIWWRWLPTRYICITWYIIKLGCQEQAAATNSKYDSSYKDMLTPSIGITKRWIWNKVILAGILQYKFYHLLAICQGQIFFQEPLVCDCVWIVCRKWTWVQKVKYS